jgi:hypothetical protein
LVVAESVIPIERPSPEPKTPEEDSQCMELLAFEDELFEEFRNTSRYTCKRRPPIPVTPNDPLDSTTLKESIRELTIIMSTEWTIEGELSSKEI